MHPEIEELQVLCARQRRELSNLQEVLRRKNLELDALHMVWCSGGCKHGVHRFTNEVVTEELVATAERNTERLRTWYESVKFRLDTYPKTSYWYEREGEDMAKKIGRE